MSQLGGAFIFYYVRSSTHDVVVARFILPLQAIFRISCHRILPREVVTTFFTVIRFRPEWKFGSINADVAGGLSGIPAYARVREARRSLVEPPNFNTEYLMP